MRNAEKIAFAIFSSEYFFIFFPLYFIKKMVREMSAFTQWIKKQIKETSISLFRRPNMLGSKNGKGLSLLVCK